MIRRALVVVLGLAALVFVAIGTDTPVAADAAGVYNGVTYTYPSYSYPNPYYNYGYSYGYGAYNTYAYNNVYTPVYGYNPYSYGYNTYSNVYAPVNYGYGYGYGYGIPPQRFTSRGCAVGNYSCLRSK